MFRPLVACRLRRVNCLWLTKVREIRPNVSILNHIILFREKFRNNYIFLQKQQQFYQVLLAKTNVSAKILAKTNTKCVRISRHQNIFHKNAPFSHIAEQFCVFGKKLKGKPNIC